MVARVARQLTGSAVSVSLTTAVAIALLMLPAAASARSVPPRVVQITLHGTNGYGIEISGNVEGAHSTVTISTGRPFSSASYSVRGTITPTSVRASFSKLGSVSLRLAHYTLRHVRLSKSCRLPGSPAVSDVRVGSFVGRVIFRGEHDFTSGSARRVHGAIGEPTAIFLTTRSGHGAKLFCLGGPGYESSEAKGPRPVYLNATSSDGAVSFIAIASPTGEAAARASTSNGYAPISSGPTTFIAADSERRGAVQISRSVISSGPVADFGFDNALTTATIDPPKPFSGSAIFQRGIDGSTAWSGSLAVSFPGLPDVALTGSHFDATLGNDAETSGESCAEYPGNRPCSSGL
jgi:hypothetical protein